MIFSIQALFFGAPWGRETCHCGPYRINLHGPSMWGGAVAASYFGDTGALVHTQQRAI